MGAVAYGIGERPWWSPGQPTPFITFWQVLRNGVKPTIVRSLEGGQAHHCTEFGARSASGAGFPLGCALSWGFPHPHLPTYIFDIFLCFCDFSYFLCFWSFFVCLIFFVIFNVFSCFWYFLLFSHFCGMVIFLYFHFWYLHAFDWFHVLEISCYLEVLSKLATSCSNLSLIVEGRQGRTLSDILLRAAHCMAYFGLSTLNLA